LQNHWRAFAVVACLLGMFWGTVRTGLVWAGLEPFEGDAWLFRNYFLDPYVAALVLGLVAARWRMIWVAALGAVSTLIVTVGFRTTANPEDVFPHGAEWSAYVEAALPWLWIAGLIALGIALSRQVGGFDFSREP
jgi:hypothetical protein